MSDFDTRQVSQIAELETKIKALQIQCAEFKEKAEKWEPLISCEVTDDGGKLTMSFGGKRMGVLFSKQYLSESTVRSACTDALGTLAETLLIDRLRPVVEPEIQKLISSNQAVVGAGKW